MNIAILFYGRLSNFKHYTNIINDNNKHNLYFFLSSDNEPDDLLNKFIELYKPISYINEPINKDNNDIYYNRKRNVVNINNVICHMTNKKRVFNLLKTYIIQNNINIDIVLSIRLDLLIKTPFIFNENINDNSIYIPNCNDYGGVNDQIAYGNYNIMEKYMNIIDNIDLLLDKYDIAFHPETFVSYNIQYYNINIIRFELDYFIDR